MAKRKYQIQCQKDGQWKTIARTLTGGHALYHCMEARAKERPGYMLRALDLLEKVIAVAWYESGKFHWLQTSNSPDGSR